METIIGNVYHNDQYFPMTLFADGKQYLETELSPEQHDHIATLPEENGKYKSGITVYINCSEQEGRGFDVYLAYGKSVLINVGDFGDGSCRQPSLSYDDSYILFIRKSQYSIIT